MWHKGLLALGLVAVAASASLGLVPPSPITVAPAIHPRVQQQLIQNGVEMEFDPDKVTVSMDQAKVIALKSVEGQLTQEPSAVQVDSVVWTHPGHGVVNQPVWKVTLFGAPIRLEGVAQRNGEATVQPTSRRAVTWITIDPASGEVLAQSSAGPIHD